MAWTIDNSHSHVHFSVRHMMISKVRGSFEHFKGTVEFDPQQPAHSSVDVEIDVASLNTRDAARDTHLKSADFFDVETYPVITFKSKRVEATTDTEGRITGDLTIHGVTKEVVLNVEYSGQAKSPWGTTNAGFSAQTKINRKDFGLGWNVALETGGVLVGDDITIDIELEIIQQPDTVATETETATA